MKEKVNNQVLFDQVGYVSDTSHTAVTAVEPAGLTRMLEEKILQSYALYPRLITPHA